LESKNYNQIIFVEFSLPGFAKKDNLGYNIIDNKTANKADFIPTPFQKWQNRLYQRDLTPPGRCGDLFDFKLFRFAKAPHFAGHMRIN